MIKLTLRSFQDNSFDFIYSNIVLQHIEPDVSERYVREFVRLLADGAIRDVPDSVEIRSASRGATPGPCR